jgi:hypothetical protein
MFGSWGTRACRKASATSGPFVLGHPIRGREFLLFFRTRTPE